MAKKRFTDVEKWRDPWFMDLAPTYKLLWNYLCDSCDNAGVWEVNKRLAEMQIGAEVDWDLAIHNLGERIGIIDNGRKWHVRRFVEFQVGPVLNPKSPPHAFIISLLNRHGLPHIEIAHGVGNGVGTTPKERERETEREGEEDSNARATPSTASLPLAQTKPGILELRHIPGLKLTQDSIPAWLTLVAEVGVEVLTAARDQMVAAGRDCWQPETAIVALGIHAKRKQEIVSQRAQERQQSASAERSKVLEGIRIAQRQEAIELLEAINLSGHVDKLDLALVREVQKNVASNLPGHPAIGGPFSATAKLRKQFNEIGVASESG